LFPLTSNDQPGCYYEVSPEIPIPYDGEGYLEGHGLTDFGIYNSLEVVFDFTTMSSAIFDVSGIFLSDSFLGYSLSTYFGHIGNISGNGFSSQRSIDDYSGGSISDMIGASIPIEGIVPTVGAYRSKFMSLSLNPIMGVNYGIQWGQSMDPIPILDVGFGYTNAKIRVESKRKYTYRTQSGFEFVDIAAIGQDIFYGKRSPWKDAGFIFYGPLLPARVWATNKLHYWARIYDELHNRHWESQ